MKSRFVKFGLLAIAAVAIFALLAVAGSAPTFAGSPAGAPPTVVLPTPIATKVPGVQPPQPPKAAPTRTLPQGVVAPTPSKLATGAQGRAPNGSTTKNLSTNFTLVNLSATDASVTVAYYKPDGTTWTADAANQGPFTVTGNFGQKIIAQYFDTTLSSGYGSIVLSSSQQLGAVVQIQARNQTPSMGAYTNIAPSNTFYVPQILRQRSTANGLANNQIAIQNVEGTASTTTVQFIPYPGSGYAGYTNSSITIQPYASYLYDIADETEANLPSGWYGSAIVTAPTGKNIDVVVNTFFGADSLVTYSAFPAEGVGPTWSIPQFVSRLANGLNTPVVVQNLSGGDIAANAIAMACTATSSAYTPATFNLTNTTAVANNAAYAWNPVTDNTIPGNWSGSCRLTTTPSANVVVLVQMRYPNVNANFDAFPAFLSSGTNTKVVVPLVSKRQANGFSTAVVIQNLNATNAATVKLTYTPAADYVSGGGSSTPLVFQNVSIPAGGNIIQNQRTAGDIPSMPNGWYGTLLVEPQDGTTARPIVGYVQLTNYLNPAGDTLMTHPAFGLP